MSPEDFRQLLSALLETPQLKWLQRKMDEEQSLHGTHHVPPDDLDDLLDLDSSIAKHTEPSVDSDLDKYQARLADEAVRIATASLATGQRMDYGEASRR